MFLDGAMVLVVDKTGPKVMTYVQAYEKWMIIYKIINNKMTRSVIKSAGEMILQDPYLAYRYEGYQNDGASI